MIVLSFSLIQASQADSVPVVKAPIQQSDSSSKQSMPSGEKVALGVAAGIAAVGVGVAVFLVYKFRNLGKVIPIPHTLNRT